MQSLKSLRYVAICWIAFLVSITAFAGAPPAKQQGSASGIHLPAIPPQELVRRTVDNEIKSGNDDGSHYMYKDVRQTPDGSRTKMMIETAQGTVAYLIAINGKPLTPDQHNQELQRLQNLLSNPETQSRKKKEQKADSDRVTRMFRELPKAFVYQYAGVVPGKNGHEWVSLNFQPNPNYNPPSRETSVFKAMNGSMVIDSQSERLVKIEARLFKDVNFGWGILGHLDKGGHFIVEQSDIGDNRWEPSYMNIQFTGKALLFKTINLRQIETTSDYVRVPDNLSLAQGVDMLKKRAGISVAQNGDGAASE